MADLAVAEGEENGSPKKKELKIIKKKVRLDRVLSYSAFHRSTARVQLFHVHLVQGFQQDSACQVGAPCLKCGASCPGLSLHMWR